LTSDVGSGSASWPIPIAIAAEEPPALTFKKSDLNLFSGFEKKISMQKPGLSNNFFLLVQKEFVILELFASWDLQTPQKLWSSKSLASNYFGPCKILPFSTTPTSGFPFHGCFGQTTTSFSIGLKSQDTSISTDREGRNAGPRKYLFIATNGTCEKNSYNFVR
jgi:hypothetical protein